MSKLDRIGLFMSYIYILAVLFFTQISLNNNFRRATMGNRSEDNNNLITKERRAFAQNLKKARKEAGLTQEALVKITGLSQAFISGVETAKSTLSLDNASRLAHAVGKSLRCLLDTPKK